MIEEILKNIVSEISEKVLSEIKFNKEFGYENFFHSGKESYAKRLGREFIKNKIPFDSLFDIGYGKIDNKEDENEVTKSFAEACKQTPNHIFLKDILSTDIQRDILLKTIEKFDFNACFDDLYKINSIFYILRDFRSIGVDKLLINDEINNIVEKYTTDNTYWHPNVVVGFINEGFFFNEEFMQKSDLKNVFKITYGHMGDKCDKQFEQICCNNRDNRIKYDFDNMNRSLPLKEDKNTTKRKI